jgi:hypothetical protein
MTLGMPQSSSEPKFEPELFRTGPKFGPRFGWLVEPDRKFGSRFRQSSKSLNLAEPGSNRTFFACLYKVCINFFGLQRIIFCFVCLRHVSDNFGSAIITLIVDL